MSFVNEFCAAYLRNNRSGGRKNIRCFPSCSPCGHSSSGFCGEYLMLKVSVPAEAICLAEFMLAGTEATDFAVGTEHNAKTIESLKRSKKKPLERFLEGSRAELPGHGFQGFRWKPTCYHYGFRSNKHSTLKQHVLRAYVLCPVGQSLTTYKVTQIVDTPSFSIFSSKKLDKLKPAASPAKVGALPVVLDALSTPPMAPKSKDMVHCEGLIMSDIPLADDECTPPPTPPQNPSDKRTKNSASTSLLKKQTKSRRYAGKRTSSAISEALAFQNQSKQATSQCNKRKAVSQLTVKKTRKKKTKKTTTKTKAKSNNSNARSTTKRRNEVVPVVHMCACCEKMDAPLFGEDVSTLFDDWADNDLVGLDNEISLFPEDTAFPLAVDSAASLLDGFEDLDSILSFDL